MMKQWKQVRVFLMVLALSFMLSIAGCASNNTEQSATKSPALTESEAASAEDTAAESAVETPAATQEQTEAATNDFSGRTMNVVTTSESYVTLFDKFSEETGAKVEFLSMSSGEVISRVKAEGGTPMADLWFGGGIDAFMEAKTDGLLEAYIPAEADKVSTDFRDPEGYWIAKGITVVGFLANNDVLADKDLTVPTTWDELADPKYKDEVIMSNPAISGTNYGAVKGILDSRGTEEGWAYWTKLNDNISFYGKRGKDPEEKVTAGEFAVGIIPVDAKSFDVAEKNNLTVVYPEDGIPWVPEGVAVFKNSENADIAKAFIDFMLRDDNQAILAEIDGKDTAQLVKEGVTGMDLGLPADKLMKEDLSTFGSEREEILAKWEDLTAGK